MVIAVVKAIDATVSAATGSSSSTGAVMRRIDLPQLQLVRATASAGKLVMHATNACTATIGAACSGLRQSGSVAVGAEHNASSRRRPLFPRPAFCASIATMRGVSTRGGQPPVQAQEVVHSVGTQILSKAHFPQLNLLA
jgi:hypothetical protein